VTGKMVKVYEFKCANCKQTFQYGSKNMVPTVDGREVCEECEKEMCGN
jgi:hypothetical protein